LTENSKDDRVNVSVSLHGNFQQILQNAKGKTGLGLSRGSTVGDIMRILGINRADVGLIAINDVLSDASVIVQEGDRVSIFELVGGG
jgi:sulfur carrier protein ThiS